MTDKSALAKKIIVALDVNTKAEALSLVRRLEGAEIFKIGLRLFTAEGPSLLQDIQETGKTVFLDLKFHDIPDQVAGAVKTGIGHSVHMMTLHAAGGREMLSAAVKAAKEESQKRGAAKPLLLAVTILTSLKEEQLRDIGMKDDLSGQVLKLAGMAQEEGMDGVVCSPLEIDLLKQKFSSKLKIVTPGIRPQWASAQDQKRILTPGQAVQKGVDYMVIGRPITQAPSPEEALGKILEELHRAVDSSDGENSS
jgi:orotidine-5'-phosphate decarboxylase